MSRSPSAPKQGLRQPRVAGKFIYCAEEKLWVRGVTYGTFRPDASGHDYPPPHIVDRDFTEISASGLNAIRTYTVPPRWLLDTAARHGLRVMVGLAWEHHVAFLDDRKRARDIAERVGAGVRACAGHEAVLCYAIGNEVPAPIVRWHGHRRLETYLAQLYEIAKTADPAGLVTYVNYPSTEYLDLPFLDFACFNIYLESQDRFEAYLAHLHHLAGDRPLIVAELGLDSRRHGEDVQARVLDWQLRTAFAAGAAGAFVFSWTDEWHRGGYDIRDWDFGLTRRDRSPRPALAAVREAITELPIPNSQPWPFISVIVCTRNGARTIGECLEGVLKLEYPHFEVIVVDDGSADATAAIVGRYGVRLISTPNRGLSNARNTGLAAAKGEIVAYIDDDARPEQDWLTYLAIGFLSSTHAGLGGPNVAPPADGSIAECIARAPGSPVHVMLSDCEAEHIPGCNMAFRKACLEAIGGFDPQFSVAGDDVDICWRLQQRDWTLGFVAAAMVWHHRRPSLRAYWTQQRGYGSAEALLERKWPAKYNATGQPVWAGRVYGNGLMHAFGRRFGRIYQGTWGSALFQTNQHRPADVLSSVALMPEWYLVIFFLAALSALGALWSPALLALPLVTLAIAAPVIRAMLGGARASFAGPPHSRLAQLGLRGLTASLYLLQPLARLCGRVGFRFTPWLPRDARALKLSRPRTSVAWSESWHASTDRLQAIEAHLRNIGAPVLRGGGYDRWDLEVRGGILGAVRILIAIEEHGAGQQLLRFRSWPRCSRDGLALVICLATLSVLSAAGHAWAASAILGASTLLITYRTLVECGAAAASIAHALRATDGGRLSPGADGLAHAAAPRHT